MATVAPAVTQPTRTLPGHYYHDPGIFAREQERIIATSWNCVGHVGTIVAPGAYFLASLAGESILVVRGRDGEIRAFYNVCRHRASRLCTEERGQVHASIQCRYHAWTYGLDGRLIGAPFMREDPSFDPSQLGLVPVNLHIWEGLIFVNLSEHPGSLAEQAPETTHPRVPRYGIAGLRSAKTLIDEVKSNWKLVIANYQECAHCAVVHPELSAKVPDFKAGLTTGGIDDGAEFADGVKTLTASGASNRSPLPGLMPEDHHRYYGMMLFPNVFLDMHPDYVVLATLQAVAPDHTRIVTDVLFHPDTMARADFDPSDAIDFTNLVNQQDWGVCELSQSGVASRAFRAGGIYGPHERHIRHLDDLVLEKLGELPPGH